MYKRQVPYDDQRDRRNNIATVLESTMGMQKKGERKRVTMMDEKGGVCKGNKEHG